MLIKKYRVLIFFCKMDTLFFSSELKCQERKTKPLRLMKWDNVYFRLDPCRPLCSGAAIWLDPPRPLRAAASCGPGNASSMKKRDDVTWWSFRQSPTCIIGSVNTYYSFPLPFEVFFSFIYSSPLSLCLFLHCHPPLFSTSLSPICFWDLFSLIATSSFSVS